MVRRYLLDSVQEALKDNQKNGWITSKDLKESVNIKLIAKDRFNKVSSQQVGHLARILVSENKARRRKIVVPPKTKIFEYIAL